jgi:hypothetical protein
MIRSVFENGRSLAAIVGTTKPLPARTMHLIFLSCANANPGRSQLWL